MRQRHTDTQTHRHRGSKADMRQRHTETQRHRHRDTEADMRQRHKSSDAVTQTEMRSSYICKAPP